MNSPAHSPSIEQMSEQQLVGFLRRLSESSSFPKSIDAESRRATIDRRMNSGLELMVQQVMSRLEREF